MKLAKPINLDGLLRNLGACEDAAEAADAAADAVRTKTRKQCADIARRIIPYRVVAAKARGAEKEQE